MQTNLADFIKNTETGREANAILRSCVHCGFCTATCPTYQHLGDELDSPRGRIYLIKQMLEGNEVSTKTQRHLDRCLTCRACETTCPSGVKYGRLLEIGREHIDKTIARPLGERIIRRALLSILPYPQRLKPLLKAATLIKPILPNKLKEKIPQQQNKPKTHVKQHARKMIVLGGCAQSAIKPGTNNAAEKIFDRLGISLTFPRNTTCCGAIHYHLTKHEEGRAFMRRNIDHWWPLINSGHEAILINASGCGAMVKEYGEALKYDPHYADKARKISSLARDPSEIIANEDLSRLSLNIDKKKIAFQSPCSLQHAQKLDGHVETILRQLGFELVHVSDHHLCCGSAGTYSILQPELSQALLDNKVQALMHNKPELIATANIGCQLHLESKTERPVKHWLELISDTMQ